MTPTVPTEQLTLLGLVKIWPRHGFKKQTNSIFICESDVQTKESLMIKIHAIHIGIVLSHFSWESRNHKMSRFHFHFPHLTSKVFFMFILLIILLFSVIFHSTSLYPNQQPCSNLKS